MKTEVLVEIRSESKKYVKRAMLSTCFGNMISNPEGVSKALEKDLTDTTFESLLLGRHSPIEEYIIYVSAVVTERCHTHIVRHKELGKYVHSSRPDLHYARELEDGMRFLDLRFNAKRIIEISWQRKCGKAWHETIELMDLVDDGLIKAEPCFEPFLAPSCVWFGCCVETGPGNDCLYYKTPKAKKQRELLLGKSRGIV